MSVYEVIRKLPEISVVRDRSRAMAMLDAVLSPEWDSRYYSFDSAWSPTEEMASMRDGSGNEYSIVFSTSGAYARGFDHESPMSPYRASPLASWPGLVDTVPEVFRSCVQEPAFNDRILDVDGRPEPYPAFLYWISVATALHAPAIGNSPPHWIVSNVFSSRSSTSPKAQVRQNSHAFRKK